MVSIWTRLEPLSRSIKPAFSPESFFPPTTLSSNSALLARLYCTTIAPPLHFYCTSVALSLHYHCTSLVLLTYSPCRPLVFPHTLAPMALHVSPLRLFIGQLPQLLVPLPPLLSHILPDSLAALSNPSLPSLSAPLHLHYSRMQWLIGHLPSFVFYPFRVCSC